MGMGEFLDYNSLQICSSEYQLAVTSDWPTCTKITQVNSHTWLCHRQ